MPLFAEITKTKLINRARALGVLLLPVLVLGAALALSFVARGRERRVGATVDDRGRQDETLSATSADANVQVERHAQGATTVTTYTITGRY
jgi:hypothetical protein